MWAGQLGSAMEGVLRASRTVKGCTYTLKGNIDLLLSGIFLIPSTPIFGVDLRFICLGR